MAKEKVQKDKQ